MHIRDYLGVLVSGQFKKDEYFLLNARHGMLLIVIGHAYHETEPHLAMSHKSYIYLHKLSHMNMVTVHA